MSWKCRVCRNESGYSALPQAVLIKAHQHSLSLYQCTECSAVFRHPEKFDASYVSPQKQLELNSYWNKNHPDIPKNNYSILWDYKWSEEKQQWVGYT